MARCLSNANVNIRSRRRIRHIDMAASALHSRNDARFVEERLKMTERVGL